MSSGVAPAAEALAGARDKLARALAARPDDLGVLFLAFQFHVRIGEYEAAARSAERRLELAAPESADAARALTNLALVAHFKGEQDRAEALFGRAIGIDRRIGDAAGLARDLGNSALVWEARNGLDKAEALYREALEIARSVPGALGEELVAGNLSNLGDIAKARGEIGRARALWMQSAEMFDRLGVTKWRAAFEKRFAELKEQEHKGDSSG